MNCPSGERVDPEALARALLEDGGTAMRAAIRLKEAVRSPDQHPWTAAADLLVDHVAELYASPSQDLRGVALKVVELGHGSEAARQIVQAECLRLATSDKASRRDALDTLLAAGRMNVAVQLALESVATVLLDEDGPLQRKACERLTTLACRAESLSPIADAIARVLPNLDAPKSTGKNASRVLGAVVDAAMAGQRLEGLHAALEEAANRGAYRATHALLFELAHHGDPRDCLPRTEITAGLMQGLVRCVEPDDASRFGLLVPFYERGLQSDDPQTRLTACEALCRLFESGAEAGSLLSHLTHALRDATYLPVPMRTVGVGASWALAAAGLNGAHGERVKAILASGVADANKPLRERSAAALGRVLVEEGELAEVIALLRHRALPVRLGTLEGIGWSADPRFWPLRRRRQIPFRVLEDTLRDLGSHPKTAAAVERLRTLADASGE